MKKIPNPNHFLTGTKQSPEHIKKRIEARRKNGTYIGLKGNRNPNFGKAAWNRGKKGLQSHSEETRKKMSLAKIGKRLSPEVYARQTASRMETTKRKGYHISPEGLKSMSRAHSGKYVSPETRKKQSLSWNYEKHVTPHMLNVLRNASQNCVGRRNTKPERMMQIALTLNGIKFQTHKVIENDHFYHPVDIFIEPNICVEVDGDYWHRLPKVMVRDQEVNHELSLQGYFVIRLWEKDIKANTQGCAERIIKMIKERMRMSL